MKLIDKLANRLGFQRRQSRLPYRKRSFEGASLSRLTADWNGNQTSSDAELWGSIKLLIGRARQLSRNNEYMQRYLDLIENNVLGAYGIGLQMKIKDLSGDFDNVANKKVETGWYDWGKAENCSNNRKLSWRDIQGLVIRAMGTDGNILVRKVVGANNPYRFALDVIEIDQLDLDFNRTERSGNEIRFGIERDQSFRPVAYHIFGRHPGDMLPASGRRERIRIPAMDILHISRARRTGQTLAWPWVAPVMAKLQMLGKYEEAALVRAREGAAVGYAIEPSLPPNAEWPGDKDELGRPLQGVEPGMGMMLNPGEKFVTIDPAYPHDMYADFIKSCLRAIASGLNISYNSLANDLQSVNFSSIRAGRLDEIEGFKGVQEWFINEFIQPVFKAWLETSMVFGAINLPVVKLDKFNAAEWKPRRWPWVDPLADLQAAVLGIEKGLTSRRRVIAEAGGDIEDIFEEQEEDNKLAADHKLSFPTDAQQSQAANKQPSTPDDPDTVDNATKK